MPEGLGRESLGQLTCPVTHRYVEQGLLGYSKGYVISQKDKLFSLVWFSAEKNCYRGLRLFFCLLLFLDHHASSQHISGQPPSS